MDQYKLIFDLLFPLINPYTSKFLENFDKEKFLKEVDTGKLLIDNIQFKPESFNELFINKIPIKINEGKIKKLKISLPKKSNIMKESVVIEIEDIEIFLEVTSDQEWYEFDHKFSYIHKIKFAEKIKNELISQLSLKKLSMISNLGMNFLWNLLDNLQIVTKNINIILNLSKMSTDESLIMKIKQIEYYNSNQNYDYCIIERNKFSDSFIFKYIKISEIEIICSNEVIIKPITISIRIKINEKYNEMINNKYEFEFISSQVEMNIKKKKFHTFLFLISHYDYFKRKVFELNETKKLIIYRPQLNQTEYSTSYRILLWRYAIKMIIKINKFYNGDNSSFNLPSYVINKLEKEFDKLYKLYKLSKLNEKDLNRLKYISNVIDNKIIYNWIIKSAENDYIEIKANRKKGFLELFSNSNENKETLTNDEKLQIRNLFKKIIREDKRTESIKNLFENFKNCSIKLHFSYIKISLNLKYKSIFFNLNQINWKFTKNYNKSIEYHIKIKDANLIFNDKICNSFDYIIHIEEDNLIDLSCSYQLPDSIIKSNIVKIEAILGKSEIIYDHRALNFLINFFSKPPNCEFNNKFINKIISDLNNIKTTRKEVYDIFENNFDLNITIKSRKIILPSLPMHILLDEIKIENNYLKSKEYTVDFKGISILQILNFTRIHLVENFSAKSVIKIFKDNNEFLNISVNLDLENIKINTCLNIIEMVNNIHKLWKFEYSSEYSEESDFIIKNLQYLTSEEIKNSSEFSGRVYLLSHLTNIWEEKTAYLSGGFLYFFITNNSYSYFILNNSNITLNKPENLIKLQNDSEILTIGFEDDTYINRWFYLLKESIKYSNLETESIQSINNYEIDRSINEPRLFLTVKNNSDVNNHLYKLNFNLAANFNQINMTILDKNYINKILSIDIFNIDLNLNFENYKQLITTIKINSIKAVNHLCDVNNILLMCDSSNSINDKFLSAKFIMCNETSEYYTGEKLKINLILDRIDFIYEPFILKKILSLVDSGILKIINLKDDKISNCTYSLINFVKINFVLKKISLGIIHENLQIKMFKLHLDEIKFDLNTYIDHLLIHFEIEKTFFYDLTNYPYRISSISQNQNLNQIILFKVEEKIIVDIRKHEKCCPLRENFDLFLNFNLTNFTLNFITEPIIRLINFMKTLKNDFRTLVSMLENLNNKSDDKFNLSINIRNPKVIFKPRENFQEKFVFNFENLKLFNYYNDNVDLKVGLTINIEGMILTSLVSSKKNQNLMIIPPTNLNCGILILKMKTFIDMDIDMFVVNIRQLDINNFIKIIELNLFFSRKEFKIKNKPLTSSYLPLLCDNSDHLSNPQIGKKLEINFNTKQLKINLIAKEKTILRLIIDNIKFNTTDNKNSNIQKTQLTIKTIDLFFINHSNCNDENIITFADSSRNKFEIKIEKWDQRLNVEINVDHLKVLYRYDIILLIKTFLLESLPIYEEFISEPLEFPQINKRKRKYFISNKQKIWDSDIQINLHNLLFCLLTANRADMIAFKIFEILINLKNKNCEEDFNELKDLQNIKINNPELDKDLHSVKEDKKVIMEAFAVFNNLEIFIMNDINKIRYLFSTSNNDSLLIIKFNLFLCLNEKIEIIESLSSSIILERFEIKLSYKDFLMFINAINYNLNLLKDNKFRKIINSLELKRKYLKRKNRKDKITQINFADTQMAFNDQNNTKMNNSDKDTPKNNKMHITNNSPFDKCSFQFTGKKIEIILIDDHYNVYYPFFSTCLNEIEIIMTRNINLLQNAKIDCGFNLEIASYNYIAGIWEPILETSPLFVYYIKESISSKSTEFDYIEGFTNKLFIKFSDDELLKDSDKILNINLSDMSISFLYTNFKSWLEKFLNELKSQECLVTSNMEDTAVTISNHSIHNLSGRNLILIRKYDNSHFHVLNIDETYDLEYHISSENKKYDLEFCLETNETSEYLFDNCTKNRSINVDSIEVKYHKMFFSDFIRKLIPIPYDYMISEVNFNNTKRKITIYSPIIFHNKTNTTLLITLTNPIINQNENYYIVLSPNKKCGIPNEYLNSKFEIQNTSNEFKSKCIEFSEILEMANEYNWEVTLKADVPIQNSKMFSFINLHRSLNVNLNNVREIKISKPYIIRNCLPCDLYFCLHVDPGRYHKIKKSEKTMIDLMASSDKLLVLLEIGDFSTITFTDIYTSGEIIKYIKLTSLKRNSDLIISCALLKEKKGYYVEIVIFSSIVIINETAMSELKIFYDSKRELEILEVCSNEKAEVKALIFNNNINEETRFFIEIFDAQSSYIEINTLQSNSLIQVICSKKNLYYEFIISLKLSNLFDLSLKHEFYSSILTISPSLIIHNNMELFKLFICLKEDHFIYESIPNRKSHPFYFFGNPLGKLSEILFLPVINDGLNEIDLRCKWSQPIILNYIGLLTIPIYIEKNPNAIYFDNLEKIYINVEIKVENLITNVYVYEADGKNSQFVIENKYGNNNENFNLNILVYQEGYEKINFDYIKKDKPTIFSLFNYYTNINSNSSNLNVICFESTQDNKNFKTDKYQIDEDGVIKVNNSNKNNYKHQYPFEEKILDDVKIIFDSSGFKKTISFENVYSNYVNLQTFENSLINLLKIEVLIEKIGISITFDNRFDKMKRTKYQRFELLFILISNFTLQYQKQSKEKYSNIEDSEFNLSIGYVQFDNQFSKCAKFPNVIKIIGDNLNSCISLSVFSQIYKNDKISKIKYLNYNFGDIVIGIDAEFVDAIILFVNNIFYQLKTKFIGVHEIFTSSTLNDHHINNKLDTNSSHKFFAHILEASTLNLYISISEKGFKDFLSKHFNIGSFVIALLNNLTVVNKMKVELSGEEIKYYYGGFSDILQKLISIYKRKFLSKILGFGAKSIILSFYKLFHTEENVPLIPRNARIRYPRAYYGKYKFIKKFNHLHAEILDLIRTNKIFIFKDFEMNFYDCKFYKNLIILFTIQNLILLNKKNLSPFYIIDYIYIDKVEIVNENIIVYYNQIVDNIKLYSIPCDNLEHAEEIKKAIMQAHYTNIEEYYKIN